MTFGALAFVAIVVLFALVGSVVPPRARLAVWTVIVIGGVVPWSSWVGHSHWDRVEWMPFSGTIRPRDIVLNILFYVPIGWFFLPASRSGSAGRRALTGAVIYGFVLSALTELSQVYGHGRFPGTSDIVTNTTGALVGAIMAMRRHGQAR